MGCGNAGFAGVKAAHLQPAGDGDELIRLRLSCGKAQTAPAGRSQGVEEGDAVGRQDALQHRQATTKMHAGLCRGKQGLRRWCPFPYSGGKATV